MNQSAILFFICPNACKEIEYFMCNTIKFKLIQGKINVFLIILRDKINENALIYENCTKFSFSAEELASPCQQHTEIYATFLVLKTKNNMHNYAVRKKKGFNK